MAYNPYTNDAFSLWDSTGRRLYLDLDERMLFRDAARDQNDRKLRTYAHMLLYSGARPSEGLAITPTWFAWRDQANTEGAYQIDDFTMDWDAEQVTCPNHKQSAYWSRRKDKRNDNDLIYVLFAKNDCFSCEQRSRCNRSEKHPRAIAFKPQQKHEALRGARRAQQTPDWHDLYAKRSRIEGTLSQSVRAFGLRRSRYFGLAKTHFQNEATAAAVNITRLAAWFDHKPRVTTRVPRFARLAA